MWIVMVKLLTSINFPVVRFPVVRLNRSPVTYVWWLSSWIKPKISLWMYGLISLHHHKIWHCPVTEICRRIRVFNNIQLCKSHSISYTLPSLYWQTGFIVSYCFVTNLSIPYKDFLTWNVSTVCCFSVKLF